MESHGAAKVAALFVGAVIGAGFASGQEILQFFGVYGRLGIIGALGCALAFAYLMAAIQLAAVRLGAENYRDVLMYFLGSGLGRAVDLLSSGMLAGGLVVMMAGSGAVLHQQLGISQVYGILLLMVLTVMVLYHGLTGVVMVNIVLVPLKIMLVLIVAVLAGFAGQATALPVTPEECGIRWLWSAVLYVSYNLVVPLAVLSSLGRCLRPRDAVSGAVLGGVVLGVTAALVTWAIVRHLPVAAGYQVPMLYLAGRVSPALQAMVSVIVWLAVFTTAIANAHGLVSRMADPGSGRYRRLGIVLVLCLMPLALFPFADLVRFLYPLFGYLGLVLIAAVIFRPLAGFWQRLPKKVRTGYPNSWR